MSFISLRKAKIIFFMVCLLPFLSMVSAIFVASFGWEIEETLWAWGVVNLGANPIETLLHETGGWALRFLLLSLAVTPVRKLLHWSKAIQFRRMIGLYAFFYVTCHFLVYLVLDLQFDFAIVFEDILDRPYITVGFLAFVCAIPLAITSTHAMMRRLGKNWVKLHRLTYFISILAVLHFLWLVKKDITEPLIYIAILVCLLGYRVFKKWGSAFTLPSPRI